MISIPRSVPVIVAVVFGLAGVLLARQYLEGERRNLRIARQKLAEQYEAIAPVKVIFAKEDIPEGTAITINFLERHDVPKQFMEPYATANSVDLVGLVAKAPIAKGEQVLTNKVRRANEHPMADTLSGVTPEGMRAITLGTDALGGVGGFVRPGDKVDLLWTIKVPQPGQGEEMVTITLFQGVEVLAVGRDMVGKPSTDQARGNDYTVTVSLSPQQTSVLLYARDQGRVQLSLRPKADKGGAVAVAPTGMGAVMESVFGPRAAAPPPKTQRTVEVYKGLEKSVVAVNE